MYKLKLTEKEFKETQEEFDKELERIKKLPKPDKLLTEETINNLFKSYLQGERNYRISKILGLRTKYNFADGYDALAQTILRELGYLDKFYPMFPRTEELYSTIKTKNTIHKSLKFIRKIYMYSYKKIKGGDKYNEKFFYHKPGTPW